MSDRRRAPAEPLPLPVVDNHAHLDIRRDDADGSTPAERIAQARAVGVDRIVHIGCDLPSAHAAVTLAQAHPEVLAGVALHPNEVPRLQARGELHQAYSQIESLAADPQVRVVGETGLDYYRTGEDGREIQQEALAWHARLALRLGKVLQIHDRDAHADVLTVLDGLGSLPSTVMHCFSGDTAFAQECHQRGFALSFAGNITFRNAGDLRDALRATPLDRVLVETDTPYLTPTPWRGAANSPALMPFTVRAMAEILDLALPVVCQALSENAERIYGPWESSRS